MKSTSFAIFVAAVLIPVSLLSAQTKEDDYAKAKAGVKAAEIKMGAAYKKLVADIRAKNEKGIADGLVMRLEKSQNAWQRTGTPKWSLWSTITPFHIHLFGRRTERITTLR